MKKNHARLPQWIHELNCKKYREHHIKVLCSNRSCVHWGLGREFDAMMGQISKKYCSHGNGLKN